MENKKLPASYRIALGQIKRYFGDSKPTEKEVKKIAVEIAKRNKLDDVEFFMKWSLGQIGTVNEDLDEKADLSSYSDVISDMTDKNQHMEVRLLMAKLTEDKRLIELVKATNNIIDYERSNPISTYTNKVYDYLNTAGRKKFGKVDWDKYIYSNT